MEIVLVEMEATHEIVGGLGKWPFCQEVGEELGDPPNCWRGFCDLQMGDPFFVCTGESGGEVTGDIRKRRSLVLYPNLYGDP